MKFLKILSITVIVAVGGTGVFRLISEKRLLEKQAVKLKAELDSIVKENKYLTSRIEYLKNPQNLVKELKSEFNYREQDEKLIILVPKATSTR
mgnify:CR=1 FL=1